MTQQEHFRDVISAHIAPLTLRRRLIEVRDYESTRGAVRDYKSEGIYIRISCERGSTEVEVGSCCDDLRAVSFYKDLLSPPPEGKWNLSVQQASDFIDHNWDWFVENLNDAKAHETIQRVDAHARRK